ncbi:MAG: GTPase HflX [Rhizobiaceae bacterium]
MRAAVIVPILGLRHTRAQTDSEAKDVEPRSAEARLDEATGLALAIELDVVHRALINVSDPRPATLIGKGAVEQIATEIEEQGIGLVIVDHPLTPVQQRNLEREWKIKVIDRTGLILEIFGRRAKTREGVLQVELAHLTYQKGRLVRSWTHLERQRGGGGFMGGPGETQIESDRRLLQAKIDKLKTELEHVTQTRKLHRAKRQKAPYPVVALVGYTNAGKSTLFNRLTGAGVMAADMLFATLDPTLRRLKLPHGGMSILSDTVGFISNLPTHLVAAFRATLEEVVEADLVIHVRDISDPDTNAQAQDVETILRNLGLDPTDPASIVEVWNKIDLIEPDHLTAMQALMKREPVGPRQVAVSAVTGEGIDVLLEVIENRLEGKSEIVDVKVPVSAMDILDWVYRNGMVLARRDNDDGSVDLSVRMSPLTRTELEKRLH